MKESVDKPLPFSFAMVSFCIFVLIDNFIKDVHSTDGAESLNTRTPGSQVQRIRVQLSPLEIEGP